MKNKYLKILLSVVLIITLISAVVLFSQKQCVYPFFGNKWNIKSPDGNLKITVSLTNNGNVEYSVMNDQVDILNTSSLGFVLEDDNLSEALKFKNRKQEKISGSYTNITGKNSKVYYECNQSTLTFKAALYYLDIIVRAYDDGYAIRYKIRPTDENKKSSTAVINECTGFKIPEGSTAWIQNYKSNLASKGDFFSYEELYNKRDSNSLDNNTVVMPLMYKAGMSDRYSIITEAAVIGSGYWGSFLEDTADDGIAELITVHNVAGAAKKDNIISLPFTSPWRVASVGTLKEAVDSEITEKVYDSAEYWKPDNFNELSKEEQATYDYSWVEPGAAAWSWLIESSYGSVAQSDWDMQYRYLELAEKMGWKYTILDAGWNQDSLKVTEFCDIAEEKGINVIVWCDAFTEFQKGESVGALRNKLEFWHSWGIDGIKIDFFDGQTHPGNLSHQGEDSRTIKWYEQIYQECARLQMVVNCHGSNKPTGERRIYPNVINREAVYGNEFYPSNGDATVNSLFVRGSVGPTDFTPLVNPIRSALTVAHQMALAALYESGQPSMAGKDTHYTEELSDFYKTLFSKRDETIFLCGELDGYYCSASRSGDAWIVAGVNSDAANSTASIDFSFLPNENYSAIIYRDELCEDGTVTLKKETEIITNASKRDIKMLKSGGFVICLTPR